MLTSKQRAALRKEATKLDTIIFIGKGDLTNNIIKQTEDALTARELIKGKVLDNSECTSREVADKLAAETDADVVQVIGNKFVLYRRNIEKCRYDDIL